MKSILSRFVGLPSARVLSNGKCVTLIHGHGGGFSRCGGMALNDWNADPVDERGGVVFHLNETDTGEHMTLGQEAYTCSSIPLTEAAGVCQSEQAFGDLGVCIEACVGNGALEARRVTLRNNGPSRRTIEITSCIEIALAPPTAHASHPAFSKLFVQTEFEAASGLLKAHRRPRANNEKSPCVFNALLGEGELQIETDRLRFLGRGGRATQHSLSGTTGNVLDPMFTMQRRVEVPAGGEVSVVWLMGAGETGEEAMEQWKAWQGFDALAHDAIKREQQRLISLSLCETDAVSLQALAAGMFYGVPELGASAKVLDSAAGGFGNVWGCGMPTDRPFTVVLPGDDSLVQEAICAQRYWQLLGLNMAMLLMTSDKDQLSPDEAGSLGIVQRPLRSVPESDLNALLSVARLVIDPASAPVAMTPPKAAAKHERSVVEVTAQAPGEALTMDNGYGGFSLDGREYVIRIKPTAQGLSVPPLPWINVLANSHGFGCLLSETGAGCTWARNSRERRLTPWSNDPVLDPHGEAIYVRDRDTGRVWSPMPGPSPSGAAYETRHGWGYTVFKHHCADLEQSTTVFVDTSAPVKFVSISIRNLSAEGRRLSLVSYARLVLGFLPAETSRLVRVTTHGALHALTAVNKMGGEFANGVTFSAVDAVDLTWSSGTSRTAFLGAGGDMTLPDGLATDAPLCGNADDQRDPCFAQKVSFELQPHGSRTVTFMLGEGASHEEAEALIQRYRKAGAVDAALSDVKAFWQDTLMSVQVRTPSPAIDFMVNGWLTYQNLSSRMWARTAFYQCSGAFGFRDQLQDSGALIHLRPDLTRKQILLHAAQQFVEGDVTHWWHEAPISRGLRTRFSDDLNWLPFITSQYVNATGDAALLNESVPFLKARFLEPGEDEAYLAPELSGESGSIYEHCCRSLDRSLTKGAHGLPLMGTGDWNDGMNRVGREGRGESVWMGFFLYRILTDFIPICEQRGDTARVESYRAYLDHLRVTLNDTGWDGDWYRRAYYDNGVMLGSKENDECRIDALAQAWAVISGVAPADRADMAMDAVEKYLISERDGIIRLLTPAFVNTPNDPGYIKGYVAGVRENGGQYTHAACWVVQALAKLGRKDCAARLLEMLCAPSHASSKADADLFKLEPFVAAADIYDEPPHVGRGGWSWYTGSAGWIYRVATESVLGLELIGGHTLRVKPCIPAEWPGFEVTYKPDGKGSTYVITISQIEGRSTAPEATLDGQSLEVKDGAVNIPLSDDAQTHSVHLML